MNQDITHLTQCVRRGQHKHKSLLALLAGLMLLLTACDWNMSATFHEDNTADFMAELKVSKEEVGQSLGPGETFDCGELLRLQNQFEAEEHLGIEDRSEGGTTHSVSTGEQVPIDELFSNDISVENKDGIYSVTVEPDAGLNPADLEMLGLEFNPSLTFTFPGKVIEASAGRVDGNTVYLEGADVFHKGSTIQANAEEAGMGMVWILLMILFGAATIIVVGMVIWLIVRRKKQQQPVYPYNGNPPGQPGQPDPRQAPRGQGWSPPPPGYGWRGQGDWPS